MHLHMFELGEITIPTTANDGGPGHVHKTILPDGTVVELSHAMPDGPDGTPHVHQVNVRGSLLTTGDAVSPAEYIAAAAKSFRRKGKRKYSTAVNDVLCLNTWLGTPMHGLDLGNKPAYMVARNAPRLWVDAVKVGQLAGYPTEDGNGLAVTEEMIDEMVANLRRSPDPVPVDGAGVSDVHGTVDDTATEAAGWVFDAKKVVDDRDGLAHMHLLLELRHEVYAKIKTGGYRFGSIAFAEDGVDRETGEPTGAVLDSYAITNKPFVQGLRPHMVLSTAPQQTTLPLTTSKPQSTARRVRLSQPSEVQVSDTKFTFARIPQVERAIMEAAGLDPDTPVDERGERLLMKIVEANARAGMPPVPAPATKSEPEGAELQDATPPTAALAEGEGAPGDQLIAALMGAFDMPDGTPPEALLELVMANLDAIKAAVAAAPEADPNAGPGGQPAAPPPAPTLSAQGPRVVALEAKINAMQQAMEARALADKKRDAEAFVDDVFAERGIALEADAREVMVAATIAHGKKHMTDNVLRGIKPRAPQGRVTSPNRALAASATGSNPDAFLAAVEAVVAELRPTFTGSDKQLRREAFNLAQQRHPELVRRG